MAGIILCVLHSAANNIPIVTIVKVQLPNLSYLGAKHKSHVRCVTN
jgi:hypothetical protein